jgi:hypothetical protein
MALTPKEVIEVLERLIVSAETTKMNIERLAVAVQGFELVADTMAPYAPALAPLQTGVKTAISLFARAANVMVFSLGKLAETSKSELARLRKNTPPDENPKKKN